MVDVTAAFGRPFESEAAAWLWCSIFDLDFDRSRAATRCAVVAAAHAFARFGPQLEERRLFEHALALCAALDGGDTRRWSAESESVVERLKRVPRPAASGPVEFIGEDLGQTALRFHRCELCPPHRTFRAKNRIWIASADVVYLAPQMVLHYVWKHEYLPPTKGTPEYFALMRTHA